ncbi:MAG: MAPEG family protein [Gammaproteobacteria bacterium]|nr:MAPEG family protein [Gammaproteobacteria bacterium]MCP5200381.1 MAPEG family protein [Gammaproteobacteria bacterium]
MTGNPLLAPAATLVLWSLVVLGWLVATRFPAFTKAGITLANAPRGGRYADVEKDMPEQVNWVSHNYTHLMEQPTIFYAVVAVLVLSGDTSGVNLAAAWAYTGLRIAHSLWQGLVNVINVRVVLFTLSTVCLWVLAVNAVRRTVF